MRLISFTLLRQFINMKARTYTSMFRFFLFISIILFSHPSISLAQTHAHTPKVMEFSVEPRDSFQESIKLTNLTDRKIFIYPTVNTILVDEDGDIVDYTPAAMTDRTTDVTSWIEVQRGRVELGPRESVKLKVDFKIHFEAQPGRYYAFIGLAQSDKRFKAEEKVAEGTAPGVVVRIDIASNVREEVQLTQFKTNRFVFDEESRTVAVTIKNTGDVPVVPRGEVILYDVRGNEVGAVPINSTNELVDPNKEHTFDLAVPENLKIGRHKAFLQLSYGSGQTASVYDTNFFTIIPFVWLAVIFLMLITFTGLLAWWYHRTVAKTSNINPHDDGDVLVTIRPDHNREEQDHDINLKS